MTVEVDGPLVDWPLGEMGLPFKVAEIPGTTVGPGGVYPITVSGVDCAWTTVAVVSSTVAKLFIILIITKAI